jgi:tetraacyldisaccharide 4'-kinase
MDALVRLYSPFSRAVCRLKAARLGKGGGRQRHSPIPVVSVGNLTVGGSEKTPFVIELLRLAVKLGLKPALVTRGYRGSWEDAGGVLSDGRTVFGGWREAGDEPAMIALRVPQAGIFVGKHRYLSCLRAAEAGFRLCLLDDGFQHLRLARDIDVVLHDAASTSPLREGVSALSRADILLWKRGGGRDRLRAIKTRFPALSVFEYQVKPVGLRRLDGGEALPLDALRGKRVLAVSGIARPRRFASALRDLGALPDDVFTFSDHYAYPERVIERIAAAADPAREEIPVTTEKDAVKLAGRLPPGAASRFLVLEIGLVLPPDLLSHLGRVLTGLAATEKPA